MRPQNIIERIAHCYFLTKRTLLHITDFIIFDKIKRKSFCSRVSFPRFRQTINPEPYPHKINVAFCFNSDLFLQTVTTITSLLKNSPTCAYNIYCITDITRRKQSDLAHIVSDISPDTNIYFLSPNSDYSDAKLGQWSDAIYWRCMLPALLPDTDKVIYADVDTLFMSDLREADQIELNDNLIAGCPDKSISDPYINSGFMIMNLKQIRKENIYNRMIEWATHNLTPYPDQDMINSVCRGRILLISRKFNLIVVAAYGMLKNMTIQQYRDLKHPVMLHYAGKLKPWSQSIRSFFTFDLWRRYASETGLYTGIK